MALAGGLAAGLQAGANIGFNLADRKRRSRLDQEALDRQGLLDQRYTDNVARQQSQYQDTQDYRKQQMDMQKQNHTDSLTLQKAGLGIRKKASEQQTTLFNNAQTDRKFKKQKQQLSDIIDSMIANSGADLTNSMNSSDEGKQLMNGLGLQRAHLISTPSDTGAKSFYIVGTQNGNDWGVINRDGRLAMGNEAPQEISMAGIVSLYSHVSGMPTDVVQSVIAKKYNEAKGNKAKYASGRQTQADKIALEKVKSGAKQPKVYTEKVLDKEGIQTGTKYFTLADGAKKYVKEPQPTNGGTNGIFSMLGGNASVSTKDGKPHKSPDGNTYVWKEGSYHIVNAQGKSAPKKESLRYSLTAKPKQPKVDKTIGIKSAMKKREAALATNKDKRHTLAQKKAQDPEYHRLTSQLRKASGQNKASPAPQNRYGIGLNSNSTMGGT